METFGSILERLMDKKNYNSIDVSKMLNLSSAAIRHWKNGVSYPKSNNLPELANLLDVKIIDLFPNSKKAREDIVNEELKNNPEEYLHLIPNALPPILKHIPITKGYPTLTNEIIEEKNVQYVNKIYIDKRMIAKQYQEEELEGMVVVGDSMAPYLNHLDVAIYCPTLTPKGSAKYVINTPHGLEVKSLTFLSTGDLSMKTENPAFDNELIKKENVDTIEILGLVVGRILKS